MQRKQQTGRQMVLPRTADGREWKGETFESLHGEELLPEVMQYLSDNRDHRKVWKGVPIFQRWKGTSRDGRQVSISTALLPSATCIT